MQDAFRVSFVIIAIHAAWIGVSLVFLGAVNGLSSDGITPGLLVAPAVFVHICLAALATAFFMVYASEPLRDRHRLRLGFIGFSILLTVVIFALSRRLEPGSHIPLWSLKTLNTANLIVFANLLGSWITAPLKRPAEMVPLCAVVTLADLFSVFKGPSRKIIESLTVYYETGMVGPPPVADFLLLKITVPGIGESMPVFGVSDWIIIAFFSAAAVKFGFNDNLAGKSITDMQSHRRIGFYLPVSVIGLFLAVLAAQALGVFIPALPVVVTFYMLDMMIRCPDARKIKRSDWLATGGAAFMMISLMLVYGKLQ
ncbi:MAG: hypothetical protein C4548_04285 [Desulfobacteraceae bacterium]|nr:MAG: hypothetical protein C4548_04285 [Desulfobacteraceae bacterium]